MANSLWVDLLRKGLASARPVTPDFPPDMTGLWFSTDTKVWDLWDPAQQAWIEVYNSAAAATPATGVAVTSNKPISVRKMRLTLTNVLVSVADADDYGSAELCTLPDSNLVFMGAEANLTLTKDGTGYIATTDLDVALGTSAASNITLSGAMLNILPKQDVDADSLTPSLANHGLAATPVLTGVLDGATNKIYLNVSGPTETSQNGSVTVSGTVDLFYVDLGNVTS